MSYQLCDKVRFLEPYQPISGTYSIRLDANESCFQLPQEILAQIKEKLDSVDFNRYPDPNAEKLVNAFAGYYDISPETVTAGNGSDELISLIIYAMIDDSAKVLVVEPDFSMYKFYAATGDHETFSAFKNDDLTFDVDAIISKAKETNASMLILSNPCNPCGSGITADKMRYLINSVSALVVLDEAYMDFWDQSLIKEVESFDNLIVLRTSSKAVGTAGIRLGFAVANRTLTKALKSVKAPYNVNSVSQIMGEVVYKNTEILKNKRNTLIMLTKMLYNGIVELCNKYNAPMTVYPTCTNFVYIKTELAKDIFEYLGKKGIAVRYFSDGHLRISTGTQEENEILFGCIEEFFKNL